MASLTAVPGLAVPGLMVPGRPGGVAVITPVILTAGPLAAAWDPGPVQLVP